MTHRESMNWSSPGCIPARTRLPRPRLSWGKNPASLRPTTITSGYGVTLVRAKAFGLNPTIRASFKFSPYRIWTNRRLRPGVAARTHLSPLLATAWKTGRGLAIGDARERIFRIYGAPSSRSPSLRGNQELELFFYAFDWAGSEVPQVMEIYCDHSTGRVVEITLAFPSL